MSKPKYIDGMTAEARCPVCGKDGELHCQNLTGKRSIWYVLCTDCCYSTEDRPSAFGAIRAWERRYDRNGKRMP